MRKPPRSVITGGALVLALAVLIAIPVLIARLSRDSAGPQGRDPAPPTYPFIEAGPGDLAPHEVENRAGLMPKELTPEAKQRLEAEAQRISPVLESLRAKGSVTAESVKAALVGLGYPAAEITAQLRENLVVFGISVPGGCLEGDVRTERVQVLAMGPSVEWGCVPPGPTH